MDFNDDSNQLIFALGDQFFVTCFNGSPQFEIRDLETGRVIKSVKADLGGVLLSDSQIEDYLAPFESDYRKVVKSNMKPPKVWPMILKVMVSDNQIWVFGARGENGHAFRQYDSTGQLKKRGFIDSIPQVIRGDAYYSLKVGADDVVFLVKNQLK